MKPILLAVALLAGCAPAPYWREELVCRLGVPCSGGNWDQSYFKRWSIWWHEGKEAK
jgi:hypothetical protein